MVSSCFLISLLIDNMKGSKGRRKEGKKWGRKEGRQEGKKERKKERKKTPPWWNQLRSSIKRTTAWTSTGDKTLWLSPMLTLCYQVTYKDLIATSSIVNMSHILTFSCIVPHMHFSAILSHLSHPGYQHTSLGLKLQTQWTFLTHTLRTIWLQHGNHTFRHHIYFLSSLLPLEIMALWRSIMKDDNILCELYADTYSEVWWLWNWNSGQWQWPPHNSSM